VTCGFGDSLRVLIKIRKLGKCFSLPSVSEKGGVATLKADMLGELVKVPESLRDPAEELTGELTMGVFPVGLDVLLPAPNENLNGLWVQREIYDAVTKNSAGAVA
jgi:hypothetical protein